MKVLLVPANFYGAEGAIAKSIVSSCPAIDFFFFSAHEIRYREKEFLNILSSVDVVHWLMNFCHIRLPSALSLETIPCPSVATVHHVYNGEEIKIEYARRADVIHVVSKEWSDFLKDKYGLSPLLAHPSVDIKKFTNGHNTNWPHNPFRFGTFGFFKSFQDRKRLDVLIEALHVLRQRGLSFELIVEGISRNDLQDYFRNANIPIKNLGVIPARNMWKSYSKIDCYVCSSEVEGGPLPILEALTIGVPIVSTEVGLAKETLIYGGGILCPINNPLALANGLEKIMCDKYFYQKCKKEAPRIANLFSSQKIGPEYYKLYNTAIKRWSIKHKKMWQMSNSPILRPEKQRLQELNNDLLRESVHLQGYGNNRDAILNCVKSFTFSDVSIKRSINRLVRCIWQIQ